MIINHSYSDNLLFEKKKSNDPRHLRLFWLIFKNDQFQLFFALALFLIHEQGNKLNKLLKCTL